MTQLLVIRLIGDDRPGLLADCEFDADALKDDLERLSSDLIVDIDLDLGA
ncbi:hypothetical protein ACKVEX_04690 [Rhodocyclaceae bacterium SMB388]